MVLIRKSKAGADSFGHEWPEDGAVVDVDAVEALELLAIKDAGFSVAEPEPEELYVVNPDDGPQTGAPDLEVLAAAAQGAKAEETPTDADEAPADVTEGPVDPESEQAVTEAPAPVKQRPTRAPRKN